MHRPQVLSINTHSHTRLCAHLRNCANARMCKKNSGRVKEWRLGLVLSEQLETTYLQSNLTIIPYLREVRVPIFDLRISIFDILGVPQYPIHIRSPSPATSNAACSSTTYPEHPLTHPRSLLRSQIASLPIRANSRICTLTPILTLAYVLICAIAQMRECAKRIPEGSRNGVWDLGWAYLLLPVSSESASISHPYPVSIPCHIKRSMQTGLSPACATERCSALSR